MSTLYEIMEEMEFLEGNLIDEETGEIDEEIMARLDELQIDKQQKIENIALLVKSKRADAKAIKEDMKNQTARANQKEKEADRLEKWLVQILGGENFETTRCKIGWKKSQPVEILDENVIPDEYIDVRVERKPVKTLIKSALKSGIDVPGAVLIDKNNIQIK